MIRTFVTVLISSILSVVAVALCVLWILYYYGQDLPDYQQLAVYEPPVVSRLYAHDGKMFAEYAIEKRVFVPLAAIPQQVISTFLAAEDKNFFQHPGIDVWGVGRAIFTNMINVGQGRSLVGGSTITQQVAKNFFLSNEQKLSRKIKEAILTFRIEHALSKERILELYLNQIYLGQGAYGVAAAALYYFDKPLSKLSLDEMAYLAALPKAPSHYHPDRHPEAAKGRRDWVIQRMLEEHVISKEDAAEAKKKPITLTKNHRQNFVKGDYFAEEVRRELMTRFGAEALYKGGLFVRTTMNPHYQNIAESSLRAGLMDYDRRHGWRGPVQHINIANLPIEQIHENLAHINLPAGAGTWKLAVVRDVKPQYAEVQMQETAASARIPLAELVWARRWIKGEKLGPQIKHPADVLQVGDVVLVEPLPGHAHEVALRQIPQVSGALIALDPYTGRVLALAGGFSFEISEFNRATQAIRQPGSAMKPFVYLAALQKGMTPSTIVRDEPLEIDLGYGLGIWRPQNMSRTFEGPITLRVALERSRNLATIDVAQRVGMQPIAALAERFGITDHMPAQLAQVLGAGETTAMRLTAAYATLANGGRRVFPTLIDRVQDRRGKTLLINDRRTCPSCHNLDYTPGLAVPELADVGEQVADPIHVYQIVSILEGAVQRGTGWRARALGRPVAGKTGSTNEHKDAWFVGFSPDLVVGVFVGFDQPRSLGDQESGARVASPIFVDFMKEALKDARNIPFRIPQGTRLVQVNPRTGQPGGKNLIWEAYYPDNIEAPQAYDQLLREDSAATTMSLAAPTQSSPRDGDDDVLLDEGLLETQRKDANTSKQSGIPEVTQSPPSSGSSLSPNNSVVEEVATEQHAGEFDNQKHSDALKKTEDATAQQIILDETAIY